MHGRVIYMDSIQVFLEAPTLFLRLLFIYIIVLGAPRIISGQSVLCLFDLFLP